MKPIVFDLFCGLGGWSEGFIEAGYKAVGFDIEAHDYGSGGYPGKLVLCDVRLLKGDEMVTEHGIPSVIVASPPCQEFSYMAMPWSKAKNKRLKILADPGERTRLTDLFNQCFRIQREVSDAAGHYVPMVVENVRGAQEWVGKARWNFGSFYLWGDVPALMPSPHNAVLKHGIAHRPNGETNFHGYKTMGHINKRNGHKSTQHLTAPYESEVSMPGRKGVGSGAEWFDKNLCALSSRSKSRKAASAEIAKIPLALALWIAKVNL